MYSHVLSLISALASLFGFSQLPASTAYRGALSADFNSFRTVSRNEAAFFPEGREVAARSLRVPHHGAPAMTGSVRYTRTETLPI